MLIGSFVNLI